MVFCIDNQTLAMLIGYTKEEIKSGRELLQIELDKLENACVEVDGIQLKPSQCYRLETDPPHVLFNENCPESLRERINTLLKQYTVLISENP